MPPPPPWSLVYADGAANVYRFDADADGVDVAYAPMTPERSSTGHYSGGAPWRARLGLDEPRLDELWRHVDALAADRAHHATARHKGDGAFTVTTAAAAPRQFLVQRPALAGFEALLDRAFRRPA